MLSTILALALFGFQDPVPTTQTIKVDPSVIAPDLSVPQSGRIILKVRLNTDLLESRNRSLDVQIDGASIGPASVYKGNGSIGVFDYSWSVDTAQFADGEHQIRMVTYAAATSGDTRNYLRASKVVKFTTKNGKALRDVRANYSTVYLAPGEAVYLTATAVACNGDEVLIPPKFRYDTLTASVADIDASGRVTAYMAGETNVHAIIESQFATTKVIVGPHAPIPNFGGKFIASVFGLSGNELDKSLELALRVKRDGVTHLESGFYQNPADGSGTAEQSRVNNEKLVAKLLSQCEKYDMGLVGIGDDTGRTTRELNDTMTVAASQMTLLASLKKLKDSGRVVGIEVIDEVQPQTAQALFNLLGKDRPPISWPLSGGAGENSIAAILPFADYGSVYWVPKGNPISTNGNAWTDYQSGLDAKMDIYRRRAPKTMPAIVLNWIDGVTYIKVDPDGEFTPGTDKVVTSACGPEAILLNTWRAFMNGACGMRFYRYDSPSKRASRVNAPIGATVSTGGEPGDDRWQAMSSALNLIHKLEPFAFGTPMNAPDFGPMVPASARSTPSGSLLLACNYSEVSQAIRVDLSPYGVKATRYLLDWGGWSESEVTGTEDRIILKPGQCLAYVAQSP